MRDDGRTIWTDGRWRLRSLLLWSCAGTLIVLALIVARALATDGGVALRAAQAEQVVSVFPACIVPLGLVEVRSQRRRVVRGVILALVAFGVPWAAGMMV